MTDLGDSLRGSIAECGLSLRATARRAGCSAGYLSNVIHGRRPLTPSVAARLDQALGTGGMFVAYALNPPADSNGTQPGNGVPVNAVSAGNRLDIHQAASDVPGSLTELMARGTAAEALTAFTAADLASPRHVQLSGLAAVRDSELLLRTAEPGALTAHGWPPAGHGHDGRPGVPAQRPLG